ncbi:protein L-Myc-1b-like isoform 1-T2 [Pholidichthys leucotaenia]
MEFDCRQPYFYDHLDTEEDFYTSIAPSEDIWKKFEVTPTPPMSPTRTLSDALLLYSPGDKYGGLKSSKLLGPEEEFEAQFNHETFSNLSPHIIRDCMWSSFSAHKQLGLEPGATPAAQLSVRPGVLQGAQAGVVTETDCVDPAAVFTFPANSCRKPASSGSESRSDSSSDDEEEVDVVTVETKQNQARLVAVRKPVAITVRADSCPKRLHLSVHQQHHNYAAPSPDTEPEPEEEEKEFKEPVSKRSYTTPTHHPRSSRPASPSEISLISDLEDIHRRNHNFLERKRRNDLKFRFLTLRDQIPGLESTKTPKVAILTKAVAYLAELRNREKWHLQAKKRLISQQQRLLRRLSKLQHW